MEDLEKVLITGGAGFIGSHLVDDLQQDYDVYVLDNYRTGKRENIKSLADDHVFELDIREYDAVEQIMKTYQFDYVIHLAALVSVAESVEKPILSQEINVVATLKLLETIKKYNSHIKRFIFASSAAVYGDLSDLPKSDQSLILPLSPYAIDKYYGERTTLNYCSLYNIPTAVVKFFNVFGPRQDPKSQYSGVISKMFDSFEHNKPFTFFGDGLQTRDFVYVYDVVQSVRLIMEHKDAVGHGYNIGTGTFTNLLEVYRIIGELYGKSVEHDFKEARKGDIKHSYADISNLKALGFVPKYTVETGLKDYFNFEVDNIEEVTAKEVEMS
ncbi:TPA: NAD-dependent epimerase/dehydratase family protein [Staphylococcus aureus]|nr:NAD-dependent epimerase/dehydratase family protein [Staphylococcus aureus]HCY8182143.1 NAD-dependent epimerase/dehydratase family protein [Staphylococcus aureus]